MIEFTERHHVRFSDDEFGQKLCAHFGTSLVVDRMERSWRWAVVTLAVAIVGTWATLTFGVPIVAREIAFAIPRQLDEKLGRESLGLLDKLMFDESELSTEQFEPIRLRFEKLIATAPEFAEFQIYFRSADAIGANAFAIPGGLVIVTDEMVKLFENDSEVAAVLAHEVGHLARRHGLRILLQDSVSALFIAGLTGDLSNITALSAAIPTVLMQAKYSRDFEREADTIAFDYLEAQSLNTDALSNLLQRVGSTDVNYANAGINVWFSSHPQSAERKRNSKE